MEDKNFEEFNLDNEIRDKINSIIIHKELEDLNRKIEANEKKRDSNNYLKVLNDCNSKKRNLKAQIKINNYEEVSKQELLKYKELKDINIFVNNRKHNIYNLNYSSNETINELVFYYSKLRNFDYQETTKLNCLIFSDTSLDFKLSFNEYKLSKLEIFYITEMIKKQHLYCGSFKINDVIIRNYEVEGISTHFSEIKIYNNIELKKLLIDNIEIGELVLENINNNFESFELRNCKIKKLVIRNSNLGKSVFNGVTIGKLEIQNATLNDCIFNGVDIEDYELQEIHNKPSEIKKIKEYKNKIDIEIVNYIDFKVMKDNYRQLKHVMDKNANYTEANKFFALEMDYHMKSLTFTKTELFTDFWNLNINSNKLRVFGEFIILLFSKIINNFGTNIIQNLVVLSIFSGIFSIGKYIYVDKEQYYTIFSENLTRMQNDYSNNFDIFGEIGAIAIFFGGLLIAMFLIGLFIKLTSKNILLGIFAYIFFMGIAVHDEIFFNFINLLLNPTYGFKLIPNIDNSFHLTGLLIYKLFYGVLIYQLIIALKRTTKR